MNVSESFNLVIDLFLCSWQFFITNLIMFYAPGIRAVLLESEDQECPVCHEKEKTPEMLIPNRFLRKRVADFGDQTGYRKPHKSQPAPPPKQPLPEQASEPREQPPSVPASNTAAVVPSSEIEGLYKYAFTDLCVCVLACTSSLYFSHLRFTKHFLIR